ncbi:MAG TPA: hypothetical protein VJC17_00065 [Candidatus Dojkabacteria bacterium]|nr:hypothetical protein [Candidatus Dojkabacteria bacterium]
MVNSNPVDQPKDQNVLSFMVQLVQEKHGDDVEAEFINQEANRLYDQFGDNLVSYFEPMLTEQQKKEFDQLVSAGSNQEQLLNFLIQAIPDLEMKIMQILVSFRANYLGIQLPNVPSGTASPLPGQPGPVSSGN